MPEVLPFPHSNPPLSQPLTHRFPGRAFFYHNPDSVWIDGQETNFPVTHNGTAHVLVRTGTAIPEPSTLWLLCGGLAMVLAVRATKAYPPRIPLVIYSRLERKLHCAAGSDLIRGDGSMVSKESR